VTLWLRYRRVASHINCEWLGDDNVIVVEDTKGDIAGALVLTGEDGCGKGRKKRTAGKGWIRAWTVHPTNRGKGIGRSLLHEAVAVVKSRSGCGVQFDVRHARKWILYIRRRTRRGRKINTSNCRRSTCFAELLQCWICTE